MKFMIDFDAIFSHGCGSLPELSVHDGKYGKGGGDVRATAAAAATRQRQLNRNR